MCEYKLNVDFNAIKKLSEKNNLRLKKKKIRGMIKEMVYYITCFTTITISISLSISSWSPQLFKDRHNIYSKQDLTIDDSEINTIIANLERDIKKNIPSDLVDEYLLLDAVNKNNNLDEEEKQYFYNLVDIIKDNPYLNKEKAYTNLLNLDIKHVKDRKKIMGNFSPLDFELKIDDNLDDHCERNTMNHEIIHSFFEYFYEYYFLPKEDSKPEFMTEGMCALLNLEYANKTDYSIGDYPEYTTFIKMLCEIVGSDIVLKSYSTADMSYIYKSMADIKGNYDEAKDLIVKMNKLLQKKVDNELDLESKDILKEIQATITKLDEYYDTKTNKKEKLEEAEKEVIRTNDITHLNAVTLSFSELGNFYYYNQNLLESLLKNRYNESLHAKGVFAHKAYFSKRLQESKQTYIDYTNSEYSENKVINRGK